MQNVMLQEQGKVEINCLQWVKKNKTNNLSSEKKRWWGV